MDYSIPWQMENKSSHRSKSHKGEGGQEGAKKWECGSYSFQSILGMRWIGFPQDRAPSEKKTDLKGGKKKGTTNKLNGKIQQRIISTWKSKAAI